MKDCTTCNYEYRLIDAIVECKLEFKERYIAEFNGLIDAIVECKLL